jgi:uroporphyrinogen-III synthase
MKLIITRPIEDAAPLKAKLEAMGHRVVVAPLLDIVPRGDGQIPARRYQAALATSANAIRHFRGDTDMPVYVVGPQSLAAALKAGYARAEAHGGDVDGLAAAITARLDPAKGPLLYLSGAETSGDLAGQLKAAGFDVDRATLYDAVAAKAIDPEVVDGSDGVLLYSPRTAKIWVGLAKAEKLAHYCLSPNVAAQLPEGWQRQIAQSPDEESMLALLDRRG